MGEVGRTPILGAVLAGGESRRMGVPKEGVRLPDGRPMIEPVLSAMREAFGCVIVVGRCTGFDCDALPWVTSLQDQHPGSGPLAGIESLLASGLARGYVVAACDQPLLSIELLTLLTPSGSNSARFFKDGVSGEDLDPLPGYFPAEWIEPVQRAIAEGRRGFRDLVRSLGAEWVPLPEGEAPKLASINTPDDLARLASTLEYGRD